jgi:hypothetical protein
MTTLEDASFLGYDTILTRTAPPRPPDFCVKAVLYNETLSFVTQSAAILQAFS